MPIHRNGGGGQCINVVMWLFSMVFWYQLVVISHLLWGFWGTVRTAAPLDWVNPSNHHFEQGPPCLLLRPWRKTPVVGGMFSVAVFIPPGELPSLFLKHAKQHSNMPGLRMNIEWMLTIAHDVWPWIIWKSIMFGCRRLEWRAWGERFPNLS